MAPWVATIGVARAAVGDVTELPVVINHPGAIAVGPDGNFWLTEANGVIGRLTPGGSLTEFGAGITGSEIQDIAAGPDGNLWFTESDSTNTIGRITPTGTVTEFSVPTANSHPWEIAAGPDGNLWFTENFADKVARITPAGTITEFSTGITPGASPHGIAAGPDGNLWFTEASKDKVGRITPAGTVTEFSTGITPGASPLKIAAGGDGNLWFTEPGAFPSTVGRITPSGSVTEFPAPNTNPQRIAAGPDGNLWFTAGAPYTKVVRITPSGTVHEFSAGLSGTAEGIAAGPDGNMWFTEILANKVARITTGQPETRPAISGSPEVGASLTCSDGTWSPALRSVARQWLRDGVAIPGATGPSYTPVAPADRGRSVTCRVLATVAGVLVPVSAVSDAVVIADPSLALSADTLSFGSVTVGQTSASKPLTISNSGTGVLRLTGLTLRGPDFVLTDPFECATVALNPGASCTVQVAFKPSNIGSASGVLSVTSNSSRKPFVTLSGIGSAGADVPISAKVVDAPAGPGDTASIEAKVKVAPGRKIVSYRWSIDGPDPNSATIETGSLDTLNIRVGRQDGTVWVWAVDDQGNISDTPARIDVNVPENSCASGTTSGDLRLGWLHIKSTACMKRNSGGADYVVPIQGGGASINGLEVSCPSSGTCGALEIRNTDGNGQLPPGSSRGFTLKSTSKMRLTWPNGQEGTVDLGDQTLNFESPPGLKPAADRRRDTPQATATRDLNLSAPPLPPPPPIAIPRQEVPLGTFTIPASTRIGTLSTSGTVSLSIFGPTAPSVSSQTTAVPGPQEPGVKLHTDVKVAVPGSNQPASAPLDQEANANTGPETESQGWEVELGGIPVAPLFHIEDLTLRYMPLVKAGQDGWPSDRKKVFSFKAVAGIDITGWTVAVEGGFDGGNDKFGGSNGKFGTFEWIGFGYYRNDAEGVLPGFHVKYNLPLDRLREKLNPGTSYIPIELQALAGRFQAVPYLSISGALEVVLRESGFSFGPDKVLGARFSYDQQHEEQGVLKPNAFSFGVTFPFGETGVTILGDVLIAWRTDTDKVTGKKVTSGGFGLSGRAYYTLDVKILGQKVRLLFFQGGVYFYGGNNLVNGKLQPVAEFGMYAAVSVLSWEIARARILFNQNVVAGCGALGPLKGWFVHKWSSNGVTAGFGGCEHIASYSIVPQLSGFNRDRWRGRTAAAPVARLKVPAGVATANLSFKSVDGLARVRVDGPGGFSYTTPATAGIHGKPSDPAYAAMDEVQHQTIIGIPQPKPGVYRISTIANTSRIVNAEVAYSRPTTVKAKLGGSGARRTLSYTVNGPAGAKVVFDERGGGSVAHTIGMAKGSRGTIRFHSGDLQGLKRTIVAKVATPDGTNLPDQIVARYTAPALVPSKPQRLRITIDRNRARVTVTWAGVQYAVGYRVRLTTSAGRRLNLYVRGTRLAVPSVYPGQRVTVTVLAVSKFLSAGAPSTATIKIPSPKTKHKKHKK